MSDMSPFGVDHAIISKRGGRLARLFGRSAKPSQPQLLPNGKTIQQMKNAPGPKGLETKAFSGSGPTGPKPRPAPKPQGYVDPTAPTKAQKAARQQAFEQNRLARQMRPRKRRGFSSNDITRTDGPLG